METQILYSLFKEIGIQDVLPKIQENVDRYYDKLINKISYLEKIIMVDGNRYKYDGLHYNLDGIYAEIEIRQDCMIIKTTPISTFHSPTKYKTWF